MKSEVFDFEYKGFECIVCEYTLDRKSFTNMIPNSWYCGYVVIPKDHEFYDKHYDDIQINCHGGLTYSGKFHIKESRNFGKFAIGFDMNHYNDNGGSKHEAESECKQIVIQLQTRNVIKNGVKFD